MQRFRGIPASPGIAIGRAHIFTEEHLAIPKYDIQARQIAPELSRFKISVDSASEELKSLKEHVRESGTDERLLDAQIMMINDPEFASQVETGLKKELKNVEWIIVMAIEEMTDRLQRASDQYFKERSFDFYDVSRRIIRHLLNKAARSPVTVKEDRIIFAHNLMPSDTISLTDGRALGIITEVGAKTSHTAIIARSLEIPAVVGLSNILWHVNDGDEVIVNGQTGTVIINPDDVVRRRYEKRRTVLNRRVETLKDLIKLPAETPDGSRILLQANIEVPEEIDAVHSYGADGIGLYRSEFLYIKPHAYPPEDVQYEAYKAVLAGMGNSTVTIRTLDLGGDKVIPGFKDVTEDNPILGWRAVRFCLAYPDIFKVQIRALLRASLYGKLAIMFPMISGLEELEAILLLVEEAKGELDERKTAFRRDVPLGIMVEVPSAALMSDVLAKKVDFFSIGTNDLIQYMIAVDRGNEKIAYLYEPMHLAVLRIIKMIVDNAHENAIPVSMCGEMAADPRLTVVLLGLGLDSLSMSAASIPEIKRTIRCTKMTEAKQITEKIMSMTSSEKANAYLDEWMAERLTTDVEAG